MWASSYRESRHLDPVSGEAGAGVQQHVQPTGADNSDKHESICTYAREISTWLRWKSKYKRTWKT